MARAVKQAAIREEILRLTAEAPGSISPSEVARGLAGEAWRPLLGPVRAEAARLCAAGELEVLRKGKPVPPETMPEGLHGVVRLRRPGGGA